MADINPPMNDPDVYLIWSHEHGRWWGPDDNGSGYTPRLSQATRYTMAEALNICVQAIPRARGVLNELPVHLGDVLMMRELYPFKTDEPEAWE